MKTLLLSILVLSVFPISSSAAICSIKSAKFGLFFKKDNSGGVKCVEVGTNVFTRTASQPFIKFYDCLDWNLEEQTSASNNTTQFVLKSKSSGLPLNCQFQVKPVTPGENLDSYYGNGSTSEILPSKATLIAESQKVFGTIALELEHLNFKNFNLIDFYFLNKFEDYDSAKTESRIVGIFEVLRDDGRFTLLSLQFSKTGQFIKTQDLVRSYEEDCVPYLFHQPGKMTIYYSYLDQNEDLWKLRHHYMKHIFASLQSRKLVTPRTQILMSFQPNMDRFESQQSFVITDAKGFAFDVVNSAIHLIPNASKNNLFASISRNGHPVHDLAAANPRSQCTRIN